MKNQYMGDINDYRKYALLRCIQAVSRLKLGVCWMLTPDDDRSDGRKISYLTQPSNEVHDPELYSLLRELMSGPNGRELAAIENSRILLSASYFREIVPDQLSERRAWFVALLTELAQTELIFFDPDNGMNVTSRKKGQKNSSKYLFRDEIREVYGDGQGKGKSILVYQHFARENRRIFMSRISSELNALCANSECRVFQTSDVAFFLIIHPSHSTALLRAAESVTRFDPKFIKIEAFNV